MIAHPHGFQHHRNNAEQHQEPPPSTSAGSLTGKSGIDITVSTDVSLVGENPDPPCAPCSIPLVMGTAAAAWTQNPFCGWSPLPLSWRNCATYAGGWERGSRRPRKNRASHPRIPSRPMPPPATKPPASGGTSAPSGRGRWGGERSCTWGTWVTTTP
ncbi:unnamed protein product [Ectocarpus sp. 12 AP-2014]